MTISNEDGELVYEARGQFAFFSPTWRLTTPDGEVATIKRKIFSWSPTWLVAGELGPFEIRRKTWSWVRRYQVIGGPFDGAEMTGNFWDLKFKISHRSREIARAKGKMLALRDTHNIAVLEPDRQSKLFTAIAMVALHMDRNDEQNDQNRPRTQRFQ
jgi:uncharacterized protein YxjI